MKCRSLPFDFVGYPVTPSDLAHQNNNEGEMWLEFIRGSNHAIGCIYRLYANKLYNYGRQFTRNEELVLDSVHDVFLTLIKNRKNLGLATSIKLYLYASLRRNLLRQLRRNDRIVLKDVIDDDMFRIAIDFNTLSLNSLYPLDQKKIIEQGCNKLPADQREALVLYYLEEFSYEEITEILHRPSVKSVRAMIYRALESLSHSLCKWKDAL
jgi:RNA polymerase sigma-70 factor (ECF subfamily)